MLEHTFLQSVHPYTSASRAKSQLILQDLSAPVKFKSNNTLQTNNSTSHYYNRVCLLASKRFFVDVTIEKMQKYFKCITNIRYVNYLFCKHG